MKLEDLRVPHLQDLARQNNLKGFTRMGKPELVKHIRKNVKGRLKMVDGRPRMISSSAPEAGKVTFQDPSPVETTLSLRQRADALAKKIMGGMLADDVPPTPEIKRRIDEAMSPLTPTPKKRGRPPTKVKSPSTEISSDIGSFPSGVSTHLDTVYSTSPPPSTAPSLVPSGVSTLIDPTITGEGMEDEVDWDDIKWGSFTEQLKRYNQMNPDAPIEGEKALCKFAEMILSDKSKYSTKTRRRANFYLNVLAKKKCT